jgi:hypothetical protein
MLIENILARRSSVLRQIVLWLAILALPIVAHAQAPTFSAPMVWQNDHARLVIQTIDGEGKLTGTYQNAGSGFSCAGLVYPVTGWIDGDRITFSTRRKDARNCTNVQSWSGFVRGDELLVEYVAIYWNGTANVAMNGSDRYRRP